MRRCRIGNAASSGPQGEPVGDRIDSWVDAAERVDQRPTRLVATSSESG